jgi:hypothetical protein
MIVPLGTYTVSASLAGYVPASQANVVVQTNQTTTVNLTLVSVPVGYVHGTVTIVNGFGIMTSVLVSAGSNTTHPDQLGNYTLAVPPGTYNVIASLAAYIPDTVFNVAVANQQTVNGIDLSLMLAPTNGMMTGTVTLNGGTGMVTQVLVSAGGGVATTNPDASGFYSLDLPAGNYDVTASLGGYGTQMLIGIPVVVGQTTPNVNFTLVPVASSGNIQGHVTIAGEPADVTLTDVTAGGYSTHPDASGNYDLLVPAGNYTVTAVHPYTTTVAIDNVVVASGQATTGINFVLTVNRADMIVTAIVDPGGYTLNNVDVTIQGPEGPYTGTILNDSLTFLHVPYGNYQGSGLFGGILQSFADTVIGAGNHQLQFIFIFSGISEKKAAINLQVNPNPAGPGSQVTFTLPSSGKWSLEMADAHGVRVNLLCRNMQAGVHRLSLREITAGRELPDGIYFIRLSGSQGEAGSCKILYHPQ